MIRFFQLAQGQQSTFVTSNAIKLTLPQEVYGVETVSYTQANSINPIGDARAESEMLETKLIKIKQSDSKRKAVYEKISGVTTRRRALDVTEKIL